MLIHICVCIHTVLTVESQYTESVKTFTENHPLDKIFMMNSLTCHIKPLTGAHELGHSKQ